MFLKWQLSETVEIAERETYYQSQQSKLAWSVRDLEDTCKKIKVKLTDVSIKALQMALAVYNPSESTLISSKEARSE